MSQVKYPMRVFLYWQDIALLRLACIIVKVIFRNCFCVLIHFLIIFVYDSDVHINLSRNAGIIFVKESKEQAKVIGSRIKLKRPAF